MADRQFFLYNLRSLGDLPDEVGTQHRLHTAARLAATSERARTELQNAWQGYRYGPHAIPNWITHGDERLAEDRDDRKRNLVNFGIKVRANVHISTTDTSNPFLMINVERLDERGNPHWVSNAPPGEHYHVSVGPMKEIWEIDGWERKVKYLYNKFDGKNLWLYPTRVTRGWTLELDKEKDPIARDPIFQELHTSDKRWNEVPDPFGRRASEWVPNVPEPHVSM